MLNLINGLKVSALLDINKNHSRDSKRAEEDYDKALSKCKSYVNRYNIASSKKYRPCYEKAKDIHVMDRTKIMHDFASSRLIFMNFRDRKITTLPKNLIFKF